MKQLLPLRYKGSRNYLHGSDFFNSLTKHTEEITGHSSYFVQRLTFRCFATNICEITADQPRDPESIIGEVQFSMLQRSAKQKHFIVHTNHEVAGRYPFDESCIIDLVNLDLQQRRAILLDRSEFTPIEEVIVLTKYLNSSISPTSNGKWVFGQLVLSEPLTDKCMSVEVRMKNLIERKFSVNTISVDGRQIGTINFIVAATQ